MKKIFYASIAGLFLFSACSKDDDVEVTSAKEGTFTVKIENIQTGKDYFNTEKTGMIAPAGVYSFSFDAGKGAKLSLATMLVQSNDLFYGFGDTGLDLYNADGTAVTGNVTSELYLWDAGTEVNQAPGTGSNQPPRQSGTNVGTTENGTVKLISEVNDGFTYPALADMIKTEIVHDGGTKFTVTITNVSNTHSMDSPLAPGVWVIHNAGKPIFTKNVAAANGLEGLSEDGKNEEMSTYLTGKTGFVSPFAPGVYVVHTEGYPVFQDGVKDGNVGLEALAEDGNPAVLDGNLSKATYLPQHGVFTTPNGKSAAAPLLPGEYYEFSFKAKEGDRLNLASMLVQSNDLFIAFDDSGLPLFNGGAAKVGNVTNLIKLWDAGTEVNEFPGAGNNQPPRQSGANVGVPETKGVAVVGNDFTLPSVDKLIKVTISFN